MPRASYAGEAHPTLIEQRPQQRKAFTGRLKSNKTTNPNR